MRRPPGVVELIVLTVKRRRQRISLQGQLPRIFLRQNCLCGSGRDGGGGELLLFSENPSGQSHILYAQQRVACIANKKSGCLRLCQSRIHLVSTPSLTASASKDGFVATRLAQNETISTRILVWSAAVKIILRHQV